MTHPPSAQNLTPWRSAGGGGSRDVGTEPACKPCGSEKGLSGFKSEQQLPGTLQKKAKENKAGYFASERGTRTTRRADGRDGPLRPSSHGRVPNNVWSQGTFFGGSRPP